MFLTFCQNIKDSLDHFSIQQLNEMVVLFSAWLPQELITANKLSLSNVIETKEDSRDFWENHTYYCDSCLQYRLRWILQCSCGKATCEKVFFCYNNGTHFFLSVYRMNTRIASLKQSTLNLVMRKFLQFYHLHLLNYEKTRLNLHTLQVFKHLKKHIFILSFSIVWI